jgi:1,2-diacylglycerol 3-beta-galactosyltransferase
MTGSRKNHKPKILILFSDTGGGHRSAAQAVLEALEENHATEFEADMVDVFKAYAPYPLNKMPEWYPAMVKNPNLWQLGYRMVDGRQRSRLMMDTIWPWVRPAARQLIREHPADLILTVHPLFTAPVLRVMGRRHVPFIAVVTDLVTAPSFWFHRWVDVCVVPTEEVRRSAMRHGMESEQVKLLGLPVGKKFDGPGDKAELRRELGWAQDRKVVLIIGGSEGMGPLYDTARGIAYTSPECALAIVAGRNERLKRQLEKASWDIPVYIYGYVHNMPDLMKASDILVTKAGPGTICEAINTGLPMVLNSRIPGQEDGNVRYVIEEGVGRWAPSAERTARAVRKWITHPDSMARAAGKCEHIARPKAASEIADLVWEWLVQGRAGSLKSKIPSRTG